MTNYALQSRDKRSLVAVQSFLCHSLIGSRLEAFSPRDSPSKLGSPLGSSLLDRLEHN